MKKLVLLSVLAALIATSCRKSYVCSCKFSNDTTIDRDLTDTRKKDAEENCAAIQGTYMHADTTVTCSL